MIRCAAYARYSTDKQNPLSTEDQFRKCRQYAESRGWCLLETQTFKDEEISGATLQRRGLENLLTVAESRNRPFDVVIFEDTSRLSRKQADVLNLCERFIFAGVRVCFVAQGVDSEDKTFQLLLMARGMIDQLFLNDTADRVRRGMEGNLARGLHTGGRCFGYRIEKNGDGSGSRMEVELDQAETVRRIFSEYAAGDSLKTIAKRLNAENVPSPMPYRGQRHPSWAPSALWVILRNERYRGAVIWNKTRKIRNPKTGRTVHRHLPREEWKISPAEHLRIVSEDLWGKVEARLVAIRKTFRPGSRAGLCGRAFSQRYLLSGFLKCGSCGSNLVLVGGSGKRSEGARYRAKYGCPLHGRGVCVNRLLLGREALEREVLAGLEREAMHEDVVRFTVQEFGRQLRERVEAARANMDSLNRKRDRLKAEIARLTDGIARYGAEHRALPQSPALLAQLAEKERELEILIDGAFGKGEGSIDAYLAEIEAVVQRRMVDLRSVLRADVSRAKTELKKHCTEIVVTPEGRSYRVTGNWELLGGQRVRLVGGGGRDATVRLPLEFSWGVAA